MDVNKGIMIMEVYVNSVYILVNIVNQLQYVKPAKHYLIEIILLNVNVMIITMIIIVNV